MEADIIWRGNHADCLGAVTCAIAVRSLHPETIQNAPVVLQQVSSEGTAQTSIVPAQLTHSTPHS